ncbi:MAG: glycosyltransferase family 2 protein [Spirochaetaceae bacterium]|jgi:glycosyltransferase involved in cell wall biosynthesis|nr:glycosyltransferase family 2 protein [Spirochaetaceae bacterium]
MKTFIPCIIIPVYNHGKTLFAVLKSLLPHCPVIIVDDGSDDQTKNYIQKAASDLSGITVVTRAKNGGKGSAVIDGIKKAAEMGFTCALQIDADGQHDTNSAPFFLQEAAENSGALICGFPVFDSSVPASRKNGRIIANTWAKIVTLHPIADAMCGFRVYPVGETLRAMNACLDKRMGFDIDILVRLCWRSVPVIFHPVNVIYPEDGISHFRMVKDNVRISLTFMRLFFGMLVRLPYLVFRRRKIK